VAAEGVTTARVGVAAARSPFSALKVRDFRVFWAGFVVYCVSNGIQGYGLGWLTVQLAVRDGVPERGALYLGLVGLSAAIPGLALGLFGGVIADRRDRRMLLVLAQFAFAAIGLALAVLVVTDRIGLPWLLVLSALISAATSFWVPARQAIQPRIVGEQKLMSSFGLNALALNVGALTGPLIGGLLIVPFGIAGVLLVPAVLFALVAVVYLALAPQPTAPEARHASVITAVIEGLRYVRDDATVRWLMLLFGAATLLVRPYGDLLPALAKAIGTDAVGLSRLLAAVGAGSLLAGFITASSGRVPRKGIFVASGFFAAGIALALLATQTDLVPAVALVVVTSFFLMTSSGVIGALLQYATPDRLRGRVIGVQSLLIQGGMPVGTLALGAAGSAFGVGPALAVAGGAVALFSIASLVFVAVLRER
jgi:predicted MFS family arabinose efflux permease